MFFCCVPTGDSDKFQAVTPLPTACRSRQTPAPDFGANTAATEKECDSDSELALPPSLKWPNLLGAATALKPSKEASLDSDCMPSVMSAASASRFRKTPAPDFGANAAAIDQEWNLDGESQMLPDGERKQSMSIASVLPDESRRDCTTQQESTLSVPSGDGCATLRSGLVLAFDTDKGPREVVATQRPLGLDFHKKYPVVVQAVTGHACDLCIQKGWTLTHVDRISVQANFEEFHMLFAQKCAQKLPGPPILPFLFQTETSELRTVVASKTPMGMTFNNTLPARVKGTTGHAKALGVKSGWTLISFGERQTSDFMDFNEFILELQQSVTNLSSP